MLAPRANLRESNFMKARIIIPTSGGERLTYDLRMRRAGGVETFKLVFRTSEEPFERWLFYLLRDIGAHIVADDPPKVRQVLGLGASEPGIISEGEVGDIEGTQRFVKT